MTVQIIVESLLCPRLSATCEEHTTLASYGPLCAQKPTEFLECFLMDRVCIKSMYHVGMGHVYFSQPGSVFGPWFLAQLGSGKKCFYSGLPRVKNISKNMGTAGQILGRVLTRPSPSIMYCY